MDQQLLHNCDKSYIIHTFYGRDSLEYHHSGFSYFEIPEAKVRCSKCICLEDIFSLSRNRWIIGYRKLKSRNYQVVIPDQHPQGNFRIDLVVFESRTPRCPAYPTASPRKGPKRNPHKFQGE